MYCKRYVINGVIGCPVVSVMNTMYRSPGFRSNIETTLVSIFDPILIFVIITVVVLEQRKDEPLEGRWIVAYRHQQHQRSCWCIAILEPIDLEGGLYTERKSLLAEIHRYHIYCHTSNLSIQRFFDLFIRNNFPMQKANVIAKQSQSLYENSNSLALRSEAING